MSWNKWDKSSIIAKLKEYHRAGINLNVQKDLLKHDSLLTRAIERHFDSYAAAMAAARIEYVPYRRTWDKEKIVATLQRYHSEGIRLSSSGLQQHDNGLFWVTLTHFGSYRKALKAAGIDYRQFLPFREWTRRKIIAMLRRYHREGVRPYAYEMQRRDTGLFQAACNHFGSYEAAIEAAGFDYQSVRRHRNWTREQVLERLKEIHQQGGDLSPTHLIANGNNALYDATLVQCGSYRAALKAAGIDERQVMKCRAWTRDQIIGELRALHDAGQYMASSAVSAKQNKLVDAARRIFGGWAIALEAAGLPPVVRIYQRNHWTEALILQRLRELNEAGQDLRDRTAKIRFMPLYYAAREHFGTYINAVAQAGIDYDRVVRTALGKQREHLGCKQSH